MKKLLSVVLRFSMIFALCIPTFAVETDQENMPQAFSAADDFLISPKQFRAEQYASEGY